VILAIFFSILKIEMSKRIKLFKYNTIEDHDVNVRKTRLIQTKKNLRDQFGKTKHACLKYIPKTKNRAPRRVIVGPGGKPIYYLTIGRLGDHDSLDGEAYKLCIPAKRDKKYKNMYWAYCVLEKTYILAVKVVPLTLDESTHLYNPKYRTWREIKMLREVTKLFMKGITPNVPLYYTSLICNDSRVEDYQNHNIRSYFYNQKTLDHITTMIQEIGKMRKDIVGIKYYKDVKKQLDKIYRRYLKSFLQQSIQPGMAYSNKSVLMFNEISDYDFNHLMNNAPKFILRKEYILPTAFQILHGLAAIQKHTEIVHFDLHLSNVLVTEVIPDEYWHYQVGRTNYYIPNQGYIFKLWDFGRANYLNVDSQQEIKDKILRQFSRFFRFNAAEYAAALEKTFSKAEYRRYLYSFDVYRFFSAYHAKLMQSITKLSTKISSKTSKKISETKILTESNTETSKPLHYLTSRQINNLPELEILKKIIDAAFEDIMYFMINPKIKKHRYQGNAANLIKKYFQQYTSPPDHPDLIINYSKPFAL